MTAPSPPAQAFGALLAWFEALTPATVSAIEQHYASDARFKDPFNDVTGHQAIRRIFEHMYESLDAPRFVVRSRAFGGSDGFCTWVFEGQLRGRAFSIQGSTHFVFDDKGRVAVHRDYWDAAEEVYEKLPLLGAVLRRLRRRLSAH